MTPSEVMKLRHAITLVLLFADEGEDYTDTNDEPDYWQYYQAKTIPELRSAAKFILDHADDGPHLPSDVRRAIGTIRELNKKGIVAKYEKNKR